jgi:UDP-N-acetylmuramoyl-L-alanyl-D-glutamate--2,6-diaminopimelate ligase
LEAHGGFENYRKAKEELFAAVAKNKNSFGVYNLDDENVGEFLKYGIDKKIGYTLLSSRGDVGDAAISRDCFATLATTNIRLSASGSEFEINGVNFKTKLLGEFNVYNCAAAASIGQVCGVALEKASLALSQIQSIPGRLETINEGQNFTVVVDLAHTPDSYEKVFKLFKDLKNSPYPNPLLQEEREKSLLTSPYEREEKKIKIIAVFGSAGGGRDKWKRPELGRIASENADILIICNEDPYDENPQEICQQIAAGCKKTQPEIILNRRQALAKGLSLAQAGDIVLFLGKGTEQTYVEGKNKTKWDDREVAREELKKSILKK